MQQFEKFRASELLCPRCRISRPVRERLLLVLPGAELYDYRCTVCGTSCGSREAKAAPLTVEAARAAVAAQAAAAHKRARPAGAAFPLRG